MWSTGELIAARATVAGPGGRGVVRISGDGLVPLLRQMFVPSSEDFPAVGASPRLIAATLTPAGIGGEWGTLAVEILFWPGPQGPTGGPLAEIQLPTAGPLADAVVAEACRHGARLARGGEFSLRAFLAGRLDLVQAEAVLAVVDATTPDDLTAALDTLAGGVGGTLQTVRGMLLDLAADVEAAIDFADETTPDATPAPDASTQADVEHRLTGALAAIADVTRRLAGRDASAAAELPRVVLAGPPNIGKSSLFNRLVGRDAALVADEPGTTRDSVTARLEAEPSTKGCMLVDVAGVADAASVGRGEAVRAADARAREEIARAAVVVACQDARESGGMVACAGVRPRIDVLTRCDLGSAGTHAPAAIRTSCRTGVGIAELRQAILDAVARLPDGRTPATARMRAGLTEAAAALAAARDAVGIAGHAASHGVVDEAVVAAHVRRAASALGEVTGTDIGPELIDRIFARHCIGK